MDIYLPGPAVTTFGTFPAGVNTNVSQAAAAHLALYHGAVAYAPGSQHPRVLDAQKAAAFDALVSGAGIVGGPHPRYFTHLFAGNQLSTDAVVYDISGAQGHATPEAGLSVSALWTTNVGYASTLDPTGGAPLTKLRMPALNWDNAGGESLLIWWLGKATAEGAATNLLGDNPGTAGNNGIRIRVASDQKLACTINEGATVDSFSSSTLLPFDGNVHSIGIWINGQTRLGYSYVDETVQVNGTPIDPINTLPSASQVSAAGDLLRLGGDTQTGGASGSGLATATRALAIMKFAAADALPTPEQVRAAMQALRAAPHLTIRRGAL